MNEGHSALLAPALLEEEVGRQNLTKAGAADLDLPLFYSQPQAYAQIMRSTIAVNGSCFNTQRMLSHYVLDACFPSGEDTCAEPAAAATKPPAELAHRE